HHAIFLAMLGVAESSKIKAYNRSDSPGFASIGTKTGTGHRFDSPPPFPPSPRPSVMRYLCI
ncbi:hypothetical protein ACT03H_27885, partial [Pseudomonas aeruginosa]|uniref:hypothetical protein n=1 Tax=Pseudomonas aeruginosa TaxID=287 RepID=UPI00402B7A7E